jgi:solute carrier family 25 (mitochondrial S-adenosylmethionine transporter), member 26
MFDAERYGSSGATAHTLRKFRSHPLALWRGYTALAGRNLPFTALQFPLFERLREELKAYRNNQGSRTNTLAENGIITAISAGTAGAIAAAVTTPIDVVKTRIMLSAGDGEGRPKNVPLDAAGNAARSSTRKSSLTIGREILAQEGVRGLWRGGALRATWTMLGSALYLGVYDSGRVWMAQRRGEDIGDDLF